MEKIKIRMQGDQKSGNWLDNAPYILLVALIFLLPIFFIPSSLISYSYSKVFLLSAVILLSLFAWIILAFKNGRLVLPFNWLSLSAIAIPIIFFISAFFSTNRRVSLMGSGFEYGTASFILLMILLMFLISIFVRSKEKIFYFYLWFGAGFLLIALYEVLRLIFGPNFLSFNYFTDITINPVGKWNDLAIFSGVAVLLSMISLELLAVNRLFKFLFYLVMIVGLFFLLLINFSVVWNTSITITTLIGLFALIFFVYFVSSDRALETQTEASTSETDKSASSVKNFSRRIPLPSLIVLVCAVVFTLAARPLSDQLNSFFNINVLDVAPTWQSTFTVAKSALSHNFALGSGPNRFEIEWLLAKPTGVNQTDFWNTDFSYGVGIIPTFLITTGLLGILAWLTFLGLLIYLGIKTIFSGVKDRFSLYLLLSSFLVSLFLWIMHILYVPGVVTFAMAFIFTGLFLASLFREGILKEKTIFYVQDSRKGFAVIFLLVLILIGIITWGYLFTTKVLASAYANKSAIALNNGKVTDAETYIVKAINTDKDPAYYRFLSQIELARMNSLLQTNSTNSDAIKTQFQSILDNALAAASAATTLDQADYQNWLSLGGVYAAVTPLGVKDAPAGAENAYQEALKRNPKNPAIYLDLARLEVANKNNDKAKADIIEALKLKNNYIDAIFLLAQIQLSEGDSKSAVQSMQAAAAIAPNNPNVLYQLGLLDYSLSDYKGAAAAFEQAVALVPTYADAKYYLGLSYYKLGREADAEKIFQELLTANPDNQNLSTILSNLKAGRDPLSSAKTSSTSATTATSSKNSQ